MKIVVTGGKGFIGTNLIPLLRRLEHNVYSYDIKSGQDILNTGRLGSAIKDADAVIHLAAKTSIEESTQNPETVRITNITGTKNVLEACAEFRVRKFIFPSSAAVYGNQEYLPIAELSYLNPLNPYAKSKFEGEVIVKKYDWSSKLKSGIFRIFNAYGPYQDPSSPYSGVISRFISSALLDDDLIIYGNGEQTRDFVHVGDVVSAFTKFLNYNQSIPPTNIASGRATSINSLADLIISLTNSKSRVKYAEVRDGEIRYSQGDISKAKNIFRWEPEFTLEAGLTETIRFFRSQAS